MFNLITISTDNLTISFNCEAFKVSHVKTFKNESESMSAVKTILGFYSRQDSLSLYNFLALKEFDIRESA
jgi:Holliday junction resolvasome RuvABC DNA-binding subunit